MPWWQRKMFVECLNVEFAPPEEDGMPPEVHTPVREEGPEVDMEEVRRKDERFRKTAPMPTHIEGQPSTAGLAARGYNVRTVGEGE